MAFGKKEREAVSLQITKTENEKLKARVGELEGEVERLNRELERYRKDEANIAKALLFAQTRVEEMNRSAEKEFGTVRQAYLRELHDLERGIRQRRGELKLLEESAARMHHHDLCALAAHGAGSVGAGFQHGIQFFVCDLLRLIGTAAAAVFDGFQGFVGHGNSLP